MLNIIKADLYRIRREKGIYITLGLLIIFILVQVITESSGTIGVSTNLLPTGNFEHIDGISAVFQGMGLVDNYLYFLLPLIIIIADVDFSTGTVKNVISSGFSRTKYYFSKLLIAGFFAVLILIINVIITGVTVSILYGVGDGFNIEIVKDFFKVFIPQAFLFCGVAAVGVFLIFALKRTGIVVGLYIAFCLAPIFFIFSISDYMPKVLELLNYDVVSNLRILSAIPKDNEYIMRSLLIGSGYIIVSIIGSLCVFKKSELK